jgi:hypothetical protein
VTSSYPGSLDSFATTMTNDTVAATTHPGHHNDLADAINKIETELGTLPKGDYTDVKTLLGWLHYWAAFIPHKYIVGHYWPLGHGITGASALTNGTPYATSFIMPFQARFDRLGTDITSAGSTGAVVRLGLYTNARGATGGQPCYPNALIVDAGTVDSTTTGSKELTIDVLLDPGIYWAVGVSQGSPSTLAQIRTRFNYAMPQPFAIGGSMALVVQQHPVVQWFGSGSVLAALPSTFPGAGSAVGTHSLAARFAAV